MVSRGQNKVRGQQGSVRVRRLAGIEVSAVAGKVWGSFGLGEVRWDAQRNSFIFVVIIEIQ